MSFIVFNTLKKAQHYIKYYQRLLDKHYNSPDVWENATKYYEIRGNYVYLRYEGEEFCGASEPENGYICCCNYAEYETLIGRIKTASS